MRRAAVVLTRCYMGDATGLLSERKICVKCAANRRAEAASRYQISQMSAG